MGAEAGDAAYLEKAEQRYLEAVEIAPVTRLFYENLLILYARYAKLEQADALLKKLEARDQELAPSLLMAAASTFYQWKSAKAQAPAWDDAARRKAAPFVLDWCRRFLALAPKEFQDPRDRKMFSEGANATAVFREAAGDRAGAKAALAQGEAWEPAGPAVQAWRKSKGL
jgi:hypothetical protein